MYSCVFVQIKHLIFIIFYDDCIMLPVITSRAGWISLTREYDVSLGTNLLKLVFVAKPFNLFCNFEMLYIAYDTCVQYREQVLYYSLLSLCAGPIQESHCPLMIGAFINIRQPSYFQGYMDNVSITTS